MTPERWSEIERLYHAALERAPDERAAFLTEACAGNDSLRREVESLLAGEGSAEGFLEARAMDVAALNPADSGGWTGRTVSHYRIEGKLGAGGVGVVYKAHDIELGRPVAVKVLHAAALSDPERRRRFVQEARAASALNYPNIVTIHEIAHEASAGPDRDEYVAGRTLAERIGRKGISIPEALKYAIQIKSKQPESIISNASRGGTPGGEWF